MNTLMIVAVGALSCQSGHSQAHSDMSGMHHEKSADMDTIHQMFGHSGHIKRTVRQLPNGFEAVTESSDPAAAALIKKHAADMKHRLRSHNPIRAWDPLFAALFDHANKIDLKIEETARGVKITETTNDPETLKIIRAHSAAVTGFIHDGPAGMAKRHEWHAQQPKAKPDFLGKGDGVKLCPVTGEPADRSVSAVIGGRKVYFCCQSCIAAVKQNPNLYLRPSKPKASR